MSENWTREDMERMLGSRAGADMARLAADALARVEELETAAKASFASLNDVRLEDSFARREAKLKLRGVLR